MMIRTRFAILLFSVIIIVVASTPVFADTPVGGRIPVDTTWTAANSPYIVTSSIQVYGTSATAATLTIEPGVVVKFNSGANLQIGDSTNLGSIVSQGTSTNRITFTRSGTSGTWGGIAFYDKTADNTAIVENADIQHSTGIRMYNASPTFKNCTVADVVGTGFDLTSSNPVLDTVTLTNSGTYGIYLGTSYASSPTITGGSLTNANIAGHGIYGYGSPVISNYSVSISNTATYYGLYFTNTSSLLSVTNSTITNSIYITTTNITPTFTGNTVSVIDGSPIHAGANIIGSIMNNNTITGLTSTGRIEIVGEQVRQDALWSKWAAPYVVTTGKVSVYKDTTNAATLTIEPGVTVKFNGNYYFEIGNGASQGALVARGTTSDHIVFTRSGTSGTWPGIYFQDGTVDATSALEYVDIQFISGINISSASPVIRNSTLTGSSGSVYLSGSNSVLDNVTIEGSFSSYAMNLSHSSPTITGGSLTNTNSSGQGIYLSGSSSPSISNYTVSIMNTVNKYGFYSDGTSAFSLTNSTITNSIYLANYGYIPAITGNTFTNADSSPIRAGANTIAQVLNNNTVTGMTSAGRIDVVGERINQNTVWRKWPAPYNVVSGTVSVHKDATNAATLTIDPGVTIKFASNSGLQVGDNANQGSLIAQGTPGDRIVLTRSGTSGTWPGITFNDKTVDATTILEYADIQYTAEMKMNSSSPTIRNSTITDMSGYLNLSFSSPVLDTVTISNNGSYGIYIFGTLSAPVITNGSLTNANSTGQGIVGYGSPVISNYSVSIVNTAGKYGIRLDVTSSTFSLSNSTIGNGIYLGSTGITPTIAGNTFTNLDASPVHLGANLIGGLVSNNTLSGLTNAGKIEVVGETINRDGQWQKLDAPYVVSGSIAVFKDATTAATLVLDPGVVLKFDSGAGMQIGAGTQRGVLVAKGTAVQPIVFTSSQSTPVAGNWTGLTFSGSGSSQSEMEYGTVEYAGSGANSSNANVKLDASAPLFRNCVIRYSAGSGIYLTNSANWAVVLDSEISNNKWGVYSSSSNPYITNTRITGNTTAGIWNASTTVDVDARDNWWGLSTGPTHSTNPSGTGDRISDHVLYNPWLGQTPGTTLSITEAKVMPASLNPDGDNVTFVAAISAQANWTVTITDSNNDSVKIFTGTGTDINQRWYGEDSQSLKVADGVYYYKIDATDPANGNVASWPRGMVMVSRQIPIAIIDAPTDNQQFVGGTPVTIMGTASDSTNFSNYTLAYGPSENPTSWINLKTSSTPTTSGLIHIWNTTALSSSVYTLRLTVNDTAGNIATETARVRFSWIQNVTVSEAYISPNGDGIKDSTLISATFTQQANWTVTIKNSSGLGVRSYSGVGSSMSQSWDGKDEGGQAVPDGVYSYRIDAMGGFVTGPVVVDRTSPVALITPPGASAWNTVQVIGSASDENIDTYRLEFGPASGEGPWNLISSATNSVSGGTLGTWVTNDQTNTVVIPNDGYQIRLTVSDKAGNTMLATMSVTVDNLILSNISISRNNLNTANSETTSASFTVSGPSTVTLKIIPEKQGPSGAPVYQNSQNLVSAATGSFIWDGKDSAGTVVPDETYLYLVEASDGTKTDSYNPPAAAGTGSVTCTQDSYDPYKNDPMTISYTPSRPSRINISIAWGGQYFKVLDAVGRAAGSYTYDWDGRNAGGKILPETAVASCSVASLLRENHIVTTGDAISITDLKTDPYGIHLAYGQFTRIKYALNRDALVTVTIISPQGTSSVVLNSQLNSSGAHEVVWNGVATADGKEFVVSEEGDYIVTVQAVNPLTGTVSTKRGGLRIKF